MSSILYVMEPPEGQFRTEVNPPNSAGQVIPAGVATTVIAILAVCLRLFTRTFVVKGVLGLDDYLCLGALGLSVAFLGASLHLLDVGAGHHMWDVPVSLYSPKYLQTFIGSTLVYAMSISFAKLSILTFYLRISPDRLLRRIVYGLIGLVVVYNIVYILLFIFNCRPVAAAWDVSIEGTCMGYLGSMLALSVANVVIDVTILLLPIRIVLPLQIPVHQKVSLCLLFATGGFVCVVAIKRTVVVHDVLDSPDLTWKIPQQIIWSFIEINAGLVCASVPALKPLCVRYVPSFFHSPAHSVVEKSSGFSSEKQKKRNTAYSHSYELPSRDGAPRMARNDDDEAQLWGVPKSGAMQSVDTRQDSDSLDSASDKEPARPPPVVVGFSSKRVQEINGIHITKETYISIGP